MGVDHRAVIAIGKEFYEKSEAIDFLEQHGILSEEDFTEIEEDGLAEWLCYNEKVEGDCLNAYNGKGFYVGYDVSCASPEAFQRSFDEGMAEWNKNFPNVEPDVIRTVKVF